MMERIDKNTAENLYIDIVRVLGKFGMDMTQVYSITTDNVFFFLKAANIKRKAQQVEMNAFYWRMNLNDNVKTNRSDNVDIHIVCFNIRNKLTF